MPAVEEKQTLFLARGMTGAGPTTLVERQACRIMSSSTD
jgi:hypothetical protein